jgi:hypothetical protein
MPPANVPGWEPTDLPGIAIWSLVPNGVPAALATSRLSLPRPTRPGRAPGWPLELRREALEIAFVGNPTHVELADLLQPPPGTVKSRIHDGLRQPRRMIEEAA